MTETVGVEFFEQENNRLAYRRFGHGSSVLLAFHGFGQTGLVFSGLDNSLGEQYTILSIDLFFHGHSSYQAGKLLTKASWQSLINDFLQSQKVDRFSVMGFSLGGRFALATVEFFADRIDELMLIAPDGITRNGWYWLATSSAPGRGLFRYVIRHLSLLSTVGHFLTRLGLLNRTVMRFVEISLGNSEQRELVYRSWTQFRLINPDIGRISDLLNEKAVRVHLFIGSFDRIIPGSYVLPLTKRLLQYSLTVLQTGHNHLIDMAVERLMRAK